MRHNICYNNPRCINSYATLRPAADAAAAGASNTHSCHDFTDVGRPIVCADAEVRPTPDCDDTPMDDVAGVRCCRAVDRALTHFPLAVNQHKGGCSVCATIDGHRANASAKSICFPGRVRSAPTVRQSLQLICPHVRLYCNLTTSKRRTTKRHSVQGPQVSESTLYNWTLTPFSCSVVSNLR